MATSAWFQAMTLLLHTYYSPFTEHPGLLIGYLTFRRRASCILGKAFRYSPENAFYTFNQQIYFII